MKKNIIVLSLIFLGTLIQTTFFRYLPLNNITPDLSLIILVYVSFRYGSVVGHLNGFASGILEDFLSLSPLGFNSFIKTFMGFFSGLFQDRFILDPVIFPLITIIMATLAKGLLSLILVELFNIPLPGLSIFSRGLLTELFMNALLAPFLFQLLKFILDRLLPERKSL